ncbi:MAG: hypothetical protein WCP69_00650 [Bacteroidota bacterium]
MKNKIISLLLSIVTVLASIAIVYFAAKYDPDPAKAASVDFYLGFSLYAVYAIMALAFICLVGFAIWTIVANFRDSKESLVGVGILTAILVLAYIVSSPTTSVIEIKFAVSAGLSKLIGGGIVASYIFLFGAILAALWASVSTRFK